jgi:hypothetical protein
MYWACFSAPVDEDSQGIRAVIYSANDPMETKPHFGPRRYAYDNQDEAEACIDGER